MKHRDLDNPHPFSKLRSLFCSGEGGEVFLSDIHPETGDGLPSHQVAMVVRKFDGGEEKKTFVVVDRFDLFSFAHDILKRATFDCLEK